ncbi:MAG TPA: LuxR C-terminal-related transcriptional regulator, partial [Jiangellaceae bacterium]|nr:LuxR C-terminal-related transcriptional regulator [Jiangellaceae bacterium]
MEALFPFTKFLPPQVDERVVAGRAVERLRAAVLRHPLTIVSAPAGSGKTTALATWAPDADGPVIWVRMSRSDDAPSAAAAALLAGARRVVDGFGSRLQQVLRRAETAASIQHIVTSLVNDLGDAAGVRLVLDDFHEISHPECLALFDSLVDHLPRDVRLIVASRTEPSLSLARRRVRGEATELGMDDLRLDPESIRAVLGHDNEVSEDVVAAVARSSGGWAAAVRLTAARLAVAPDQPPSVGPDPVAAIQPDLWRFFAEEVLDDQPPELRDFLLDTAILDELTAELCASLTGRRDAAAVLSELDRRNLFLARYTTPDGHAWRYHDLFAAFLRDRVHAERSEQQIADLHLRAADVLPPAQAVRHLLAAGEHERIAGLAVEVAFENMDPSILPVVIPWVESLPSEVVNMNHRLALLLAWQDEVRGRGTDIVARLEPVHGRLLGAGEALAAAEVGLELASAYYMLGDLDREGQLLDEVLAQPLDGWSRVAALTIRLHWCRDRGDWSGASRDLESVFALVLGGDDPAAQRVLASGMSWRLLFADRGPAWVLARTRQLAADLTASGSTVSLTALRPVLAGGALLRLDIDTTAHEVRRCLIESREVGGLSWTHQKAEALLLVLAIMADDHATVRTVVDQAFARMDGSPVDAAMRYAYADAAVRSAWLRRDRDRLDSIIGLLAGGTSPEEHIVQAVAEALRARLTERGPDVLEPLAEAETLQRDRRCWLGVGVPGLERATIMLEQGRTAAALEAAEPVLASAAELGAGILLPAAASHGPLLDRCAKAGLHTELVHALRAVLERPAGAGLPVPGTNETLSPREVEVLTRVAHGRSNREIAAELFISDVTVKSHLTRILRK